MNADVEADHNAGVEDGEVEDLDFQVVLPPKRNVEVFDSHHAVVAGFWQYGTLTWEEFYRYLTAFVETEVEWSIYFYNLEQEQREEQCPSGPGIVKEGKYILLSPIGDPIEVALVTTLPRPRNPTFSTVAGRLSHYRRRARGRDNRCLITGLTPTTSFTRLQVAHIFPRAHDVEWIRKGYPSLITDPAQEAHMGGPSKIDSVQNLITLRNDLHASWDNYEFGVNPDNNYRITCFVNGLADLNGLTLQLDHIQDPRYRPLDRLLNDHFMQGLYKHMKGAGTSGWTYEDYDDAFGEGSFDMSKTEIWNSMEGKERLELALADRLFTHRLFQGVGA